MYAVSNRDTPRGAIALVIETAKQHAGQWTILALQIPTTAGLPYLRAGMDVYHRNMQVPGIADILLRWPDDARHLRVAG